MCRTWFAAAVGRGRPARRRLPKLGAAGGTTRQEHGGRQCTGMEPRTQWYPTQVTAATAVAQVVPGRRGPSARDLGGQHRGRAARSLGGPTISRRRRSRPCRTRRTARWTPGRGRRCIWGLAAIGATAPRPDAAVGYKQETKEPIAGRFGAQAVDGRSSSAPGTPWLYSRRLTDTNPSHPSTASSSGSRSPIRSCGWRPSPAGVADVSSGGSNSRDRGSTNSASRFARRPEATTVADRRVSALPDGSDDDPVFAASSMSVDPNLLVSTAEKSEWTSQRSTDRLMKHRPLAGRTCRSSHTRPSPARGVLSGRDRDQQRRRRDEHPVMREASASASLRRARGALGPSFDAITGWKVHSSDGGRVDSEVQRQKVFEQSATGRLPFTRTRFRSRRGGTERTLYLPPA